MFFSDTGRCVLNPINRSASNAAGYHPPYTATCVHSLIKAGATIAGMTKMDEFGMGLAATLINRKERRSPAEQIRNDKYAVSVFAGTQSRFTKPR